MRKRLTHIDDVSGSDRRRHLVTLLVWTCVLVSGCAIAIAASATWEFRGSSTVPDWAHAAAAVLMLLAPIVVALAAARRHGWSILGYVTVASAVIVWLAMCCWIIFARIDWLG